MQKSRYAADTIIVPETLLLLSVFCVGQRSKHNKDSFQVQ